MKIVIIGSGSGGYEAAIAASKLGADVTVIEKGETGGTCLNRGCIPTKSFLNAAHKLKELKSLKNFGISLDQVEYDHGKLILKKNKHIKSLSESIEQLFKENHIELIRGYGKLVDQHHVEVTKDDQSEIIEADAILLATGSSPLVPDFLDVPSDLILTSDDLLELEELPESIVIIGGNIVGSEVAQYLARFGVKVTMIEALDHIIPFEDSDIVAQLERQLRKDKIKILSKTLVKSIKPYEDHIDLILENGDVIEASKVLVCIGRIPNTDNLGLEAIGIKTDQKGFVPVDKRMKTEVDGIYAIGDIVNTPMLAHLASHEGITAVRNICGIPTDISYEAVPRCLYTDPEIASVGETEESLKKKNISYKVGSFPHRALGKARITNRTDGLTKIITDEDGRIIGASIVGEKASEEIGELILATKLKLKAQELADLIHPHPTRSEAIMEASRDIFGQSINKL